MRIGKKENNFLYEGELTLSTDKYFPRCDRKQIRSLSPGSSVHICFFLRDEPDRVNK